MEREESRDARLWRGYVCLFYLFLPNRAPAMANLFLFFLAWAFVVAVGHGTYLAIRAVARKFGWVDSQTPDAMRRDDGFAPSPGKDIAAFERMIDALSSTQEIGYETASELKTKARTFAGIAAPASPFEPPAGVAQPSSLAPMGDVTDGLEILGEPAEVSPKPVPAAVPMAAVPIGLAKPSVAKPPRREPVTLVHAQPAPAKRALSEVVASFLAAHNIRWGELVAGLLVVVCSIGLVVSLWSTLTAAHRVVPSLIFMSADAAIFAAGLYTMRRWKLRHTSRAVLIIATLLVPLCVLAGLAAAGASVDSVPLGSPVTLAAIAVGTLGCGWLLWQASLALVGRGRAVSLAASVVVPTLCLPLLPTAARWLGENAGGFLLIPSIAIALGWVVPVRRQLFSDGKTNDTTPRVGRRFWKNHWLHLGIAVASMASVVVYAAFLFQADGREAWIRIAIATVPVGVAIAVVHGVWMRALAGETKWATQRFICSVLTVIATGGLIAILPASIERVSWLWGHALVVAGSIGLVSGFLRWRVGWAVASVPVGVAAMLSSPAWLGGSIWSDVPVWRTVLGGEPMLVAIGLAVVGGVLIGLVRAVTRLRGMDAGRVLRSIGMVTGLWGATAAVQSIALSVAPASWLGIVPTWGLAGVLLGVMLLTAAAAMVRPVLVALVSLACVSFWVTCFGLPEWFGSVLTFDYDRAPAAFLGVAGSMLVLAIAGRWWEGSAGTEGTQGMSDRRRSGLLRPTFERFAGVSVAAACGVVGLIVALFWIGPNFETIAVPSWGVSAWMIAAASGMLAVGSVVVGNRGYLQWGMLVSAAAVFCSATHWGGIEIWQSAAWKSGDALWHLAGVLAVAAIVWLGIRETFAWLPVRGREWVKMEPDWSRRWMPDGGLLIGSVGVLAAAVVWRYLAVLCGPLGETSVSGFGVSWFGLKEMSRGVAAGRFALVGVLAGATWLCRVREPGVGFARALAMVGAAGGLFLAIVVSERWTNSPTMVLIVTTSIACSGVLVAWAVGAWKQSRALDTNGFLLSDRSIGGGTIGVLVALGSAVLLWANWWTPLSENLDPERTSTVAVAVWWVLASVGLLCSRMSAMVEPSGRVLSAVLLPAAVGIVVPVLHDWPAIVWWQASLGGSVLWLAISRFVMPWLMGARVRPDDVDIDTGGIVSRAWIALVGFGSAAVVLGGLLFGEGWTLSWSLPLGAIASLLAIGFVCFRRGTSVGEDSESWWDRDAVLENLPFLPAVMSGHVAVGLVALGWIDGNQTVLALVGCGLVACVGSTVWVWMRSVPVHAWHVGVQAVVLFGLAIMNRWDSFDLPMRMNQWVTSMALAGLATSAVALMRFGRTGSGGVVLGWFVVSAGNFLLLIFPWLPGDEWGLLTFLMAWTGGCVMLWRSDRLTLSGDARAERPDVGVSVLLLPMLAVAIVMSLPSSGWLASGDLTTRLLTGLSQGAIALLVAASAWSRPALVPGRPVSMWTLSMWTVSMALIAGGAAVGVSSVAGSLGVAGFANGAIVIVAAMSSLAIVVSVLPLLERGRSRLALSLDTGLDSGGGSGSVVDRLGVDRLGVAVERVLLGWVAIGVLVCCVWGSRSADVDWVRLSLGGIAIAAWALFQLSEQTQPTDSRAANRRRHQCVSVGLGTVGLLAVFGQPEATAWLLTSAMRLLIASVLAVGVILLAVPRLIGGALLDRWKSAFRYGGRVAAGAAVASMVVTLGIEVLSRQTGAGIPGIELPLVIVVAMIMGGFALMAGAIAVMSGPGFGTRVSETGAPEDGAPEDGGRDATPKANWLRLDDSQRRRLLYVAQAIAGATWLHVFLCRGGGGLRAFWPYIVMLIAFASVGLTQWAIRRRDEVLAETMRKTALFLPLIPVVGFWLSGAYATMLKSQAWSWTFYQGTASYAGLLIVGAIYYGVMSVMWKRGLPRIATVILANGALWVTLTQMPGWDFLTHPQAWLIPPAMCVLAVAWIQRDRLDNTLGTAIRYAATLMIYISSTADMLMSEIGSSLWGPVLLIALSLTGMLAGVVMRIKPFLYLGTIFVLLGVTSMVWHAGQAIDAVWPWWVFGIMSGLILLSALAGIEKHRDKLQRWSDELARWE